MSISVNPLKFAANALEPFISEKTIGFHYGKHLQNYVNTANTLIKDTPLDSLSLIELVKKAEGAVFNNAAQAYNHQFYFDGLSPQKMEIPAALAEKINSDFGSFENFRNEFITKATGNFGSGWTWLVVDAKSGKLAVKNTSNAGNPITEGDRILLTIDVWEHAYYLDYQNLRKGYVEKFFDYVDWNFVNSNLNS